ncbi:MAG TPA: hypothetical protein VF600_18155 [Abditibacteriaceae bacterium]|jgi:hypothetical protein
MPKHSSAPSPSAAPPEVDDSTREVRLPSLFAIETHLVAWQGLSATTPADWNLALFGGDRRSGHLRVDDVDGPRLELRWEKPTKAIDLERSVDDFLGRIGRQLKKQKEEFSIAEDKRIVSKSRPHTARRKDGLVHFGWSGERDAPIGQGWGAAWQCPDCGRVVVAHIIGRGRERSDKVQRLAGEVLASMSCHGKGGWQTWSVFDLSVDIPEEFDLSRAKLLTGRLELEWALPRAGGMLRSFQRDERLQLGRWSLADTILRHESLHDWARRTLTISDKLLLWRGWQESELRGHSAVQAKGSLRDLRRRLQFALQERLRPTSTQESTISVWHCPQSNKIFALGSDLSPKNRHVAQDVLDSLECH